MALNAAAEVKARLDIVEVISDYMQLKKSGNRFKGLCPLHGEKTPSFSISQENQVWYCFGCQSGGDLISFVQRMEHLEFPEALSRLAERAGVELEQLSSSKQRGLAAKRRRALELHRLAQAYYEHVLWSTPTGEVGQKLLSQRGISPELAKQYGLGFAPLGGAKGDALMRYLIERAKATVDDLAMAGLVHSFQGGSETPDRFRNRLLFPIRNDRGEVIGFGGRGIGDAIPKYLNSTETPIYHKAEVLYGLDLAKSSIVKQENVVVVEGYFDVLAVSGLGIKHVVASSGTALSEQQVRQLSRLTKTITLCFDNDEAGKAATSRVVDVIAALGLACKISQLPREYKDPDELAKIDTAKLVDCINSAQPEWQVLLERAIGEKEISSSDERRSAVERVLAVLVRIPQASTREIYVQQIASRLGLSVPALSSDVERAKVKGQRRPRVTLTMTKEADSSLSLDESRSGHDIPAWEGYLGSVVLQRPGYAAKLQNQYGLTLEELTSGVVRCIVNVAQNIADTAEKFPLQELPEAGRSVAAMLAIKVVPELQSEAALTAAIAESVMRVQRSAKLSELSGLERELQAARNAGQSEKVLSLVARKHDLNTAIHQLAAQYTA